MLENGTVFQVIEQNTKVAVEKLDRHNKDTKHLDSVFKKFIHRKTLIKDEEIHHSNIFELVCVIAHNVARMHKHSHFIAIGYLAYLASKAGQVTSSSQLSPQIHSQTMAN